MKVSIAAPVSALIAMTLPTNGLENWFTALGFTGWRPAAIWRLCAPLESPGRRTRMAMSSFRCHQESTLAGNADRLSLYTPALLDLSQLSDDTVPTAANNRAVEPRRVCSGSLRSTLTA